MKKLLTVLLALSLIFAFAACGPDAPLVELPEEELAPEYHGMLNLNGMDETGFNEWLSAANDRTGGTADAAVFYNDLTTMLLALDKGDISAIDTDLNTANYAAALNEGSYAVETETGLISYQLAVAAENTVLLEQLDTALAALETDGTLAALQSDYLENVDPAAMPEPAELPVIEGAETVRVIVTGDLPPMDYLTPAGEAAGYNIALLSAIAAQARINFELVSANAAARSMMIGSGKADAMLWCSIMVNEAGENMGTFDIAEGIAFTRPFLTVPSAIMTLAE